MPGNDSKSYIPTNEHDGQWAPLIAIIGSDGAGKTTIASYLCNALKGDGATYSYLGLGSGTIGLKIRAWPLIGPIFEQHLTSKAQQARNVEERIPGLITALTIYAFSLMRARRFKQMLNMRKRMGLIICDRYPQVELPGFYDGPGLSAARPRGYLTALLAIDEFALYQRMARYRPTLVIRLNIDVETALVRKPDHNPELIKRKVDATPLLRFGGARIVDVDATLPLLEVQSKCLELIMQMMSRA
ncbi:hypothetical protein [Pseudomonas sp. URMO17WK12:I12]|uniref:hypothetical protein n=1 Tax=Pseudomonas sp. URMO17WK12:I12 TaxID=1259797 RepID=UPI0004B77A8D|nr:hypothetical protein [Pseudomonas sp. URMO17WK12:I12]